MAKALLWATVILIFIAGMILHFNGSSINSETRILLFGSLSVLALCESIERIRN